MTETLKRLSLPAPTEDVDQAERDLKEYGMCFVANALSPEQLERVRSRLELAMEDDRNDEFSRHDFKLDTDDTNQRVWGLLSRGRPFVELAEHPIALRLLRSVIGPDILLSSMSANITFAGGGESLLHADMVYMPEPWSGPQGANAIWLVDDFTAENGGTVMVPGSHALNRKPGADDQDVEGSAVVAPAGTLCIMEGRVWHKTGANSTGGQRRAGIFAWYTTPIYRPQENWHLSISPRVLQTAGDELAGLLGFDEGGMGRVNGQPSIDFLRGR